MRSRKTPWELVTATRLLADSISSNPLTSRILNRLCLSLDDKYFNNLKQHKGLFTSDETLLEDARTKRWVTLSKKGGTFSE